MGGSVTISNNVTTSNEWPNDVQGLSAQYIVSLPFNPWNPQELAFYNEHENANPFYIITVYTTCDKECGMAIYLCA